MRANDPMVSLSLNSPDTGVIWIDTVGTGAQFVVVEALSTVYPAKVWLSLDKFRGCINSCIIITVTIASSFAKIL